jgi:integrase
MNNTPTVEDYSIELISTLSHEGNTMSNYQSSMNTLNTMFGKVKMKDLLPSIIQKKMKESGLSSKTVRNYVGILSSMYNAAIANKVVQNNPCKDVILPKKKKTGQDIDPWTKDELKKILDHYATLNPQHYNLVLFLAETGVRPAEMVLLRWGDVYLEAKKVRVERAYFPIKGVEFGGTKLPKNDLMRSVDLSDQALLALNNQRQYTYKNDKSFVFPNVETGQQLNYNHFRDRNWYRVLKALELPQKVLYSLRHTFGSQKVSMGQAMKYVSVQMGHQSIAITEASYAKWMESENEAMLAITNKANPVLVLVPKQEKEKSA